MAHVALPSNEEEPVASKPLPPAQPAVNKEMLATDADGRTVIKAARPRNEPVLHVITIRMAGKSFSGIAFLNHRTQFTKDELDTMIAEAVRITNEVRIANRRKELAEGQQPITDPVVINETLFQTDVTFFEAVMSDKYGFEVVRGNVLQAQIEPTIRGV